MKKQSHVMIIGAMKAGTTTLFDYLKNHPSICGSIKKEPNFFLEKDNDNYSLNDYDALFHFEDNLHELKMEGSTGYTKYPKQLGVPKRIYDSGLKPKFVYIVRNPIDRINSEINYLRNHLKWKKSKISDNLDFIIARSNYDLQLEQYVSLFSKKDILVLNFDDLKKNPQGVVDKVCVFLEISSYQIKVQNRVSNKTELKSDLELEIIKKYANVLKLFPVSIKNIVKNNIRKVSKTSNWELTHEEKQMVKKRLENSLLKFGKEYNFDIKNWEA